MLLVLLLDVLIMFVSGVLELNHNKGPLYHRDAHLYCPAHGTILLSYDTPRYSPNAALLHMLLLVPVTARYTGTQLGA